MTGGIQRVPVYRYVKSGKLAGIFVDHDLRSPVVIELSNDMSAIVGLRNPKYVRRDGRSLTKYVIEVIRSELLHV